MFLLVVPNISLLIIIIVSTFVTVRGSKLRVGQSLKSYLFQEPKVQIRGDTLVKHLCTDWAFMKNFIHEGKVELKISIEVNRQQFIVCNVSAEFNCMLLLWKSVLVIDRNE